MHFYKSDGSSMHTIIGANGKERTTSIADARKLGLFPSVTTIMDVQAKPALIQWLQNELLDAAVRTPFHPDEFEEGVWRKKMLGQMKDKGRKAAERGTEIHRKLDRWFLGTYIADEDVSYIEPVIQCIKENFGIDGWVSEQSFTDAESGFAGCVDLHHPEQHIIIDFKTKDKENLKGVKQYDDHKIQLAAYQLGLRLPSDTRRFNLFVSTSPKTPGQCLLLECTEYKRHLGMFSHLHQFWMLKNSYNPIKGAVK